MEDTCKVHQKQSDSWLEIAKRWQVRDFKDAIFTSKYKDALMEEQRLFSKYYVLYPKTMQELLKQFEIKCKVHNTNSLLQASKQLTRDLTIQRILPVNNMGCFTPSKATNAIEAPELLHKAASHISDRADSRDVEAERSMEKCVNAFNALYGKDLTETEGWQFMSILKKARASVGTLSVDDYEDDAAYAALAGESAIKHNKE